MEISTNNTYAATEIARAHSLSQKYSSTWSHYCKYCRYADQEVKASYEVKGTRHVKLIQVQGTWYRVPQVTRELKKLFN